MKRAAIIVSLSVLLPASGGAILTPYGELNDVPRAEDVIGFINEPAFQTNAPSLAVQHGITFDDLRLFLREGTRSAASAAPGARDRRIVLCGGMFFTKDGKGFHFSLRNRKSIALSTDDYKACVLTLSGDGVAPFEKKLVHRGDFAPDASPRKVRALLRPSPVDGAPVSVIVTADSLRNFLQHAVRLQPARKYYQLRAGGATDSGPNFFSRPMITDSGGFADESGRAYLWRFFDRDWLWLERDDGKVAFYLMVDPEHMLQGRPEYLEDCEKWVRERLEKRKAEK